MVCATVIPVLFLAVAVQGDAYKSVLQAAMAAAQTKTSDGCMRRLKAFLVSRALQLFGYWIWCAGFIGELLALMVLYQGHETRGSRLMVFICTILLIFAASAGAPKCIYRCSVGHAEATGPVSETTFLKKSRLLRRFMNLTAMTQTQAVCARTSNLLIRSSGQVVQDRPGVSTLWPMFQTCLHVTEAVQRFGNSVGYSRPRVDLFFIREVQRPALPAGTQIGRPAAVRDANVWPTRVSNSSLVSRPCTNAALSESITCSRSAWEAPRRPWPAVTAIRLRALPSPAPPHGRDARRRVTWSSRSPPRYQRHVAPVTPRAMPA